MREVDPNGALVRNSRVHADPLPLPPSTPEVPSPAALVDMVVLSTDSLLGEAIRHAVGTRTAVWRAGSAAEAVDLLLSGRCGVLLVDMAAMSAEPGSFVRQIQEQFSDVVVVAAGERQDEPALAGLISEGLVYRFMHKPISPRRARMFLDAAVRCHLGRRSGDALGLLAPGLGRIASRTDRQRWLLIGGVLATFAAVVVAISIVPGDRAPQAPGLEPAPSAPVVAVVPRADPVLARARAAFAAGRDEAPPGRNALDLYSAVLLSRPDDVEASEGLAATAARLVAKAEAAASVGNAREARRLAARVLDASPEHAGARALLARLDPPRQRVAPAVRAAPAAPPSPPAMPAVTTGPPIGSSVADPVMSRHASAVPPARPSATTHSTGRTAPPAPAKSAMQASAPVVRPDPLTPIFIRRDGTVATSSVTATRRSYGAPVSPAHRTAGYVKRPAPSAGAALRPLPAAAPANEERADASDLEPLAMAAPVYPPQALRARVEGWVEVEYTVTAEGTTGAIKVVAAEPRGVFDAAAVQAVAGWRFRPRIVNGEPTPQRAAVTLRFSAAD